MLTRAREAQSPLTRVGVAPRVLPLGVLMAALAVAVLRAPFVAGWLGKDEAGYLAVAQQWHVGGTSLYGNYWVDRPPLLITIFRAAALLGGTVPLRLIGIVASVVTVLAVGWTIRTLATPRVATWSAVTAAALLASPLAGATEVNGEILAAPFIAVGIAGLVGAVTTESRRRGVLAAALAGGCAVAAVLVKQNMLDVYVFGGALGLLTLSSIGVTRAMRIAAGFLGGSALTAVAMAVWTRAHGTSLRGVWFAMYQFRIEADSVMVAFPSAGAVLRGHALLHDFLASGMVLLAALLVVDVVRARRDYPSSSRTSRIHRAVPVALAATVAYDAVSISLGGNFWSHYLVQLAVPLALAAGLAVARRPRVGRLAIGAVVGSASLALLVAGPHPMPAGGNPLGAAIGAVARPGDTIVAIWGHPDVTRASGLSSPYPYLWSLPARTLDPQTSLLTSTLTGPHAPTWFAPWSGTGLRGIDTSALAAAVSHHYHQVADLDGHRVYLHNGVHRAVPVLTTPTS